MKSGDKKFRLRLVFVSTAVLLAVLVGAQAAVLLIGRKDAIGQLEASAKGVAVSVAHTLSMDAEGYREFIRTKDPESAYYKKMHDVLESIRGETEGVKFIDTERRLDADTTEILLDAEPMGSRDYLRPGETNRNDPIKDTVFTKGALVSYGRSVQTVNRRGEMIEADAPIVAEHGEILGAVCVDIEVDHLFRQFRRTVVTLVAADILFVGLFMVSMLCFSDAMLGYLFRGGQAEAPEKAARPRREPDATGGIQRIGGFQNGFALMVLELDGLGDAHGRPFVDKALAAISEIIRRSIRPEDSLVRHGKKGFALIVADQASGNAADVAERIRAGIEGACMINEEKNEPIKMTASIGVAFGDGQSQSAEDLAGNAERALAMAKAKGNSVSVFGRWDGGALA